MSEVHNGEQNEQKYLYPDIFYGGQKLHKYFSSLVIKDASLLTCSYIGELLKAVVNTVGGLLASRRVFSWLPLGFFCSYSTDSD